MVYMIFTFTYFSLVEEKSLEGDIASLTIEDKLVGLILLPCNSSCMLFLIMLPIPLFPKCGVRISYI